VVWSFAVCHIFTEQLYSVNLQDLRKGLADLREGLRRIRQELGEHFSDINENNKYGKQMWAFVSKANLQMEDLIHDVNNADSMFTDVLDYYGEEDKNISSSEFYAIFKTFVTSYKVSLFCIHPNILQCVICPYQKCQMENQTAADEKLALEKRKQAQEESRVNRQKALDTEPTDEDSDVLDALLQKLRNGDTVSRRTRRRTRLNGDGHAVPLSVTLDKSPAGGATADIARDMLAQLQSQGFVTPASPTVAASQRRRRRRTETASSDNSGSPLVAEIHEIQEETEVPVIIQ
jgi:cytokinesis protein